MNKFIIENDQNDGVDRRGFLQCMAWAGTGLLVSMTGGVARSQTMKGGAASEEHFQFVQISDSHIGFRQAANQDVAGTLQQVVDRINALPSPPALVLHTGDITHLSKPEEFDDAQQILRGVKAGGIFYVPGEHDVLPAQKGLYLERYGKGTKGAGWYSFDQKGVHFIGLVNVVERKEGFGALGEDQLEWLEDDLRAVTDSTPVVVFAHIPLWTVYEKWGWGTGDGVRALEYLRRFGSVTVLNGHIHQTMRKVEGSVAFHTANSTAFPQPRPGEAAGPGPLAVPSEQLRKMLGLTEVNYVRGTSPLAVMDQTLDV